MKEIKQINLIMSNSDKYNRGARLEISERIPKKAMEVQKCRWVVVIK
jgi:hypothetical protein